MSHVWLIQSLAELRDHAVDSGLTRLAEHLDESIRLAHLEIAALEDPQHARAPAHTHGDDLMQDPK